MTVRAALIMPQDITLGVPKPSDSADSGGIAVATISEASTMAIMCWAESDAG